MRWLLALLLLASVAANAATVYVSTAGNDATAVRGDPSLPALTLTRAVAMAAPGDVVKMGTGIFPLGVSHLDISGITLSGSGRSASYITGGAGVLLWLKGSAVLEDFTVTATNTTGTISFPVDTFIPAGSPAAAITMRNVDVYGYSDGISVGTAAAVTFQAINCSFNSAYDAVILYSSHPESGFLLSGCDVRVSRHPTLFGVDIRGVIIANGAAVTLTGNSIHAQGGSSATKAIYNLDGDITLDCNVVTASSDSGNVYTLHQVAGSTVTDAAFSTSQVRIDGGTLTAGSDPCQMAPSPPQPVRGVMVTRVATR